MYTAIIFKRKDKNRTNRMKRERETLVPPQHQAKSFCYAFAVDGVALSLIFEFFSCSSIFSLFFFLLLFCKNTYNQSNMNNVSTIYRSTLDLVYTNEPVFINNDHLGRDTVIQR